MEVTPEISTATPPVAPIPAPTVVNTPATVQAPPPPTPTTLSSSSGDGETFLDALNSMNWLEVGFGVLGIAALCSVIDYYRYNINVEKKSILAIQNKTDELAIKISDIQTFMNKNTETQPQVFV